jgi:hypothetical protein
VPPQVGFELEGQRYPEAHSPGCTDVSGGKSGWVKAPRYPALTIGIRCATGGSAGKSVYGVL